VPPAGIIRISDSTNEVLDNDPNLYREGKREKHCILNQIYFSRPDSFHFGENVYAVREKIGAALLAR
jgi:glutamine phosphoribosylpyrophosphate amidotransferase